MRNLLVPLLLSTLNPASAVVSTDWTLVTTPILDQNSASYSTPNGVGSPSVVWDTTTQQFIMVFEYLTDDTDTTCTRGIWGLGIARSDDNVTWTVDADPLFVPTPSDGTYHSCVAAHPSVMWSDDSIDGTGGDDLRVYFKGEQGTDGCSVSTPEWGCNFYTGVGDILVDLDSNGEVESIDVATTPNILIDQEFGYSSTVQRASDGKYILMVQQKSYVTSSATWELYVASSFSERGGWGSVFLGLKPGQSTWNADELATPTLMCMDNGSMQAFVVGRDFSGGSVVNAGWSVATNTDGLGYKWTLSGTRQFSWANPNDWKHLDALRVDDGTNHDEYLIWYSYKDTSDNKIKIGSGYTTTSWVGDDVVDRRCD